MQKQDIVWCKQKKFCSHTKWKPLIPYCGKASMGTSQNAAYITYRTLQFISSVSIFLTLYPDLIPLTTTSATSPPLSKKVVPVPNAIVGREPPPLNSNWVNLFMVQFGILEILVCSVDIGFRAGRGLHSGWCGCVRLFPCTSFKMLRSMSTLKLAGRYY